MAYSSQRNHTGKLDSAIDQQMTARQGNMINIMLRQIYYDDFIRSAILSQIATILP